MKSITTLCFAALLLGLAAPQLVKATPFMGANECRVPPASLDTPNLTCNINYAGLSNVNTLNLVVQVNNFSNSAVLDSSLLAIVKYSNGQTMLEVLVPPIPAGGHQSLNLSTLLPAVDLLPGAFSIAAYADYTNKVAETDDFDNSALYSIDIPTGLNFPDLALTTFSPLMLSVDSVKVSFSVKNVGGGITPASSGLLALHPDSSYNWYTGLPLGSFSIPALSTGQTFNITQTLELPPVMRSGHFFLEISAGSDLNNENNRTLIPFAFHSPFVNPKHILLGEGMATSLRQNKDQSYTVLIKTPDKKARAVQVSPQGDITSTTDIGLWGEQTKFAGDNAFVSIRQALPGFYLTKTTSQGTPLWSKYFPMLSGEVVSGVSPANDGGFIVCGAITTPNPTGPSTQQPFLLRTDSLGDELWRRTTGPAASALTDIVNLPNGSFGAISNALGYLENKFGVEIFRISADGSKFAMVDAILRSYQGTFNMSASNLRAGTDSTLYYVTNLVDFGKWTVYYYATYGKTNGWKAVNTACGGVCGNGSSHTGAFVTIPTNDGGGLAAGTTYSVFNDFSLTRLDAQGKVVWRRPYSKNVSDGLQNASGDFVLCGNMGTQAYLTFVGADGDPVSGDVACLNDKTAPILEKCPDNVTINTPETSASVNWVVPVAADNCGLAMVQSNVQPGSFGVGDHDIVFMATDQSGNTSSCHFTVTVVHIPCLPIYYFTGCSDNFTPADATDDSLYLSIHMLSPTPGQWSGVIQDALGFAPFTGDFNIESHFAFSLSNISPYILDKQMVVQVTGLNGNACQETIVFNFDSSQYCYRILALTDLAPTGLKVLNGGASVGMNLGFQFTLHNKGNVAAASPIKAAVRFSLDALPSADDWAQQLSVAPGVAAGDSTTYTKGVLLPGNFPPGNYFLLLQVDPDGDFTEFNEANNHAVTNVTITPPVTAVDGTAEPQAAYQVLPNPFGQSFTLQCPASAIGRIVQVQLLDGRGRRVFNTEVLAQIGIEVNPGDLPAGVYFFGTAGWQGNGKKTAGEALISAFYIVGNFHPF